MNAKQRVHAALRRQPVDRIPVFMWFHPQTARHLAGLLEIPAAYVAEAMGNDVRQTWVNNNYAMEGIVHQQEGEWHVDDWGIQVGLSARLQPDRALSPGRRVAG